MGDLLAGRYELLGVLGRGVLGEVVKVRDTQSGAVVAMKLFKPQSVSASAMGRFEREFRAISRLSHPNIIHVHDFGVDQGRPYFTMELLEGMDLRRYVQDHRPGPEAPGYEAYANGVAYVFHQICDALAVVHGAGLVHRDIKPENIFVKPGKFPRAKLLDFGHAKEDRSNENLTVTGTVLGTAWYIPPEQAMGKPAGPAADLYSMGCVLYESLVGKPPFPGTTVMDMVLAHIQREPPTATKGDPRVPEKLSDLVLELLRKDPDARPPATAVLEILGSF
jgi:serine/threonine-protein kinase